MRMIAAFTMAMLLTSSATAQAPPKPGAEHKMLAKLAGTWDTTMKAGGMEHKGTVTFTMELGGLWLAGSMESDLGGEKYFGKSMDTYDVRKKKYVGIWFDSMSTTPLTMIGDYDKEKKTLTLVGEGVGMDGKPAKWKSVSVTKDEDNTLLSMYVGDSKEPMFTVAYKRRKK